ncbi:MAG: nicotinate-nucleotide adenylyltransferase [bacterium]|jgi:nicotinate-nucleotide adenylyltransferase
MDPELKTLLQLWGQTKARRIAIMGGTFDPIHYGHLVAAEAARVEFNLDKVVFVPNRLPPHKKNYRVTAAIHRYQMTVLATITNPFFYVSQIELERPGPSYTVDTLRTLRKELGAEIELFFISGADAILDILTWKDVEEVLEICSFIAATRPGYPLEELSKRLGHLQAKFSHKVSCVEVPALAISSSSVRERVTQNRPIKYLLPESVEYYIYKYKLYQGSGEETQ